MSARRRGQLTCDHCPRPLPLGPWSWSLCPRCMASGRPIETELVSRAVGAGVALLLSIACWGLVAALVVFLFAGCSTVAPMPDSAVFEVAPLPSDSDIFAPEVRR